MTTPSLLFDLDGTLVDSVYQHVLAWREALETAGLELSVWRIHRRIGMSGGLFLDALLRETGRRLSADEVTRVQRTHAAAFARQVAQIRPLPGARELLTDLTRAGVPWAIAVWDLLAARRARALGVGLLSGGYGQDELEGAGAYRVYQDPADLLRHLDEVGVRVPL